MLLEQKADILLQFVVGHVAKPLERVAIRPRTYHPLISIMISLRLPWWVSGHGIGVIGTVLWQGFWRRATLALPLQRFESQQCGICVQAHLKASHK